MTRVLLPGPPAEIRRRPAPASPPIRLPHHLPRGCRWAAIPAASRPARLRGAACRARSPQRLPLSPCESPNRLTAAESRTESQVSIAVRIPTKCCFAISVAGTRRTRHSSLTSLHINTAVIARVAWAEAGVPVRLQLFRRSHAIGALWVRPAKQEGGLDRLTHRRARRGSLAYPSRRAPSATAA